MVQIPGIPEHDIRADADAFEQKIVESLSASVREVTGSLSGVLTPEDMAPFHGVWVQHVEQDLLPMLRRAFMDAMDIQFEAVADVLRDLRSR